MLDFAEHAGLADNPECTVAYLTLGNVLLDRGRVEEAAEAITRGTELAGRHALRRPRTRRPPPPTNAWPTVIPSRAATGPRRAITGREQSVLRLLPTSLTPREIASELYLSLNTIKTHTARHLPQARRPDPPRGDRRGPAQEAPLITVHTTG